MFKPEPWKNMDCHSKVDGDPLGLLHVKENDIEFLNALSKIEMMSYLEPELDKINQLSNVST